MKVAVVDHGMGNLRSVRRALERAGADVVLAADPAESASCDALCVPGQGIFDRCLSNLQTAGWDDAIASWIGEGRPYLGICLGMQILFESSEEGQARGLKVLRGEVRRLPDRVRVPHIGWNEVEGEYYYFDHSYGAYPADDSIVAGWCEHGDRFAAEIRSNSVLGVQFHPEKSATAGLALLENWLKAA